MVATLTNAININLGSQVYGGFSTSYQTHVVDAADDGIAFTIQSIEGELITNFSFYVILAGTSPTFKFGLEAPDGATGKPAGTYLNDGGGEASGTATITTGWNTFTLDNDYQTTVGEMFHLTFRYSSGFIDGSNDATCRLANSGFGGGSEFHGEAYKLTGGSWLKLGRSIPYVSWASTTKVYGWPNVGTSVVSAGTAINDICALKFSLPAGLGSTYRIQELKMSGGFNFYNNNVDAGIYSAAGGALSVSAFTAQEFVSPSIVRVRLDPDTDFSFGTTYYAGFRKVNSGGSANGKIITVEAPDNATLEAYPGGTGVYIATWDDSAGTWTEFNTKIPMMCQLVLSQIDPGGGGGPGPQIMRPLTGAFPVAS